MTGGESPPQSFQRLIKLTFFVQVNFTSGALMNEFIYAVTEIESGFTTFYKTYDRAVRRAQYRFDDVDDAEWSEITVGRHGYWKGLIDGEFQLVFVEAKNIF